MYHFCYNGCNFKLRLHKQHFILFLCLPIPMCPCPLLSSCLSFPSCPCSLVSSYHCLLSCPSTTVSFSRILVPFSSPLISMYHCVLSCPRTIVLLCPRAIVLSCPPTIVSFYCVIVRLLFHHILLAPHIPSCHCFLASSSFAPYHFISLYHCPLLS